MLELRGSERAIAPVRPGDRVRVVAPASPFDRGRFDRGLEVLRKWGLVPEIPEAVYARRDYLAGDDNLRAGELLAALEDPEVALIWCARGGYGSSRILPRLVQARITTPKLLVGFSDISALIALCHTRLGLHAIHGPVLTSLPDEPPASQQALRRILQGQATGLKYAVEGTATGEIEGALFATNLTLLAHLAGTPYVPDLEGCILVVEDVGERPYRLDRCWTQIRQAGVLAGVVAIVLGWFHDCVEADGSIDVQTAHDLGLEGVALPVYRGLEVGHRSPNYAMPVGARACISDGQLIICSEITAAGA